MKHCALPSLLARLGQWITTAKHQVSKYTLISLGQNVGLQELIRFCWFSETLEIPTDN